MLTSNPVTVVHLVERLEIGGLERAVETIVKGLNKKKYNVDVWCLAAGGSIADDISKAGIELKILGLTDYYNILNILKLSRLLMKTGVKILHSHGYYASTFGRMAGIISRVPVMITHVQTSHWKRNKRHILIDRILSSFTDKIVSCSETARRFLIDVEGIKEEKVVTIHNAVDFTRFENRDPHGTAGVRKELGLTRGEKVIGTIGRLDPVKGQIYLLKAAQKIIRYFPDIKFLLIGDGPLGEDLKKMAREMGISGNVIFTGERTDIHLVLPIIDIFVLPSAIREGLPNVIPEAEACSKPVIASRLGGIPESVMDGITGFLVTPGAPDELAEKIIYLLNNPSVAKTMGEKGKAFCRKHFSSEIMVEKLERLYSELLLPLNIR